MSKQLKPVIDSVETANVNSLNKLPNSLEDEKSKDVLPKNMKDLKDLNARELKAEFNKTLDSPVGKVASVMNPIGYAMTKTAGDVAFKGLEESDKHLAKNEAAIQKRIQSGKELIALDDAKKPDNKKTNNSHSRAEQAEAKFGDIINKSDSMNKGLEL